jgi:molybdate transport system substrate-binding protein
MDAVLATVWSLLLACQFSAGQSLTVAAESDLQAALPAIADRFEKDTGQHVGLTFGSSGNFVKQIRNGASFDVFLSADIDAARYLAQSGLADRRSLHAFAAGRLVVWTRNDSGIDVRPGLKVVADQRVRRIAIANPRHAPYGRAGVAALRHERLYEGVRKKFVLGENISQTAQLAQSGRADVGVLARSLAVSPALESSGTWVELPDSWYPPIEQAAIVLAASRQKGLARRFIEYLKKPESVRILEYCGFAVAQTTR